MTKSELEAALAAMTERATVAEKRPTYSIENCSVGNMTHKQSEAIIALAQAAEANAWAISEIANKSAVFVETGFRVGP